MKSKTTNPRAPNRPSGIDYNPTRLLTAINSTLREYNQRVIKTLHFSYEKLGMYRLSEYHLISFDMGVLTVLDADVNLEKLGEKLGVLGPYDSFENGETGNGNHR